MRFDVVVIGAGAAGLFCAAEAGKRGRKVAVLDHADRAGKKILISGGGRCNFTNLYCQPENFLSANPHFCKSALARYTAQDFLSLVEKHGIRWHEKTKGQLFCDDSARDITNLLERLCAASDVRIFLGHKILSVRRENEFLVETNQGTFSAESLVIATGGPSIPKIGATAFGQRLAEQFGLRLQPLFPALVPLVLAEPERRRLCDLSGVSAEVAVSCAGAHFQEKMLITHRGISGPAVLQISSYWKPQQPIFFDLLPGVELPSEINLRRYLPKRLADRISELHNGDISAEAVHHWPLFPEGTEGYAKAEVTGGGVDTAELSSKTMEARKVPGLYFIGEVVDVTGHLGGHNFQWAWASGYCAGQYV